ncbi:MAG TPA: hypothetical protein VHN77_14625 [Phycisphaerales bacterium]|nr:hypothetical protein [Phycisphaerales bacterium]
MPNQQSPQPQASPLQNLSSAANVLAIAAGTFALFAEVTLFRKNFGARYFNTWRSLLVIPLLMVFPIAWPREDPRFVYFLLLLFLLSCAWHRLCTLRRRWKQLKGLPGAGPIIHSQYNGEPRLARRFPKLGEVTIKRVVEPLVMLGFGLAALTFSPSLGWFFLWCSAGMFVHTQLLYMHHQQQSQDLVDATLESEQLAVRVREERGDVVRIHRSRP